MEVKLVVVGGEQAGKEIPVRGREFLIGRGEECQLRSNSKSISRRHCAIVVDKGVVTIKDFDSTNGTFVNGERVQKQRKLKSGDRITIYKWEFEVQWAVAVQGKMKPKVRNVQEAAARTVASAAPGEDDWDIDRWLLEDESKESVTAPAKKPAADEDTAIGKVLTDTAASPAPPAQSEAQAKEKVPTKAGGQSRKTTKPTTDNASSAVNDMFRQFFGSKR